MKVYVVFHAYESDEQDETTKMIGVYSSEEEAMRAVDRLRDKPGFRDHPDGWHVEPYPVDQDFWTEGFRTERVGE